MGDSNSAEVINPLVCMFLGMCRVGVGKLCKELSSPKIIGLGFWVIGDGNGG